MKERPLTEFINVNGEKERKEELRKEQKGPWELPEEWKWVRLGNIVIQKDGIKRGPWGGSIKKEHFVPSGYKVYEQKNVIKRDFTLGHYYIDDKKFQELKDFEVKPGDVLITAAGTLGKIAIVPDGIERGIINQALIRIRLDEKLINKYFFVHLFEYYAQSGIFTEFSRGGVLKNLASTRELKQLPVPLPPLEEQKRIVKKLDEIRSRVEEAKRLAREAREKAEQLMASTLHEIFSKAEERGWKWHKLKEVCEKITDRDHKTPKYVPKGIPVISPENFTPFGIDFENVKKFISEDDYKRELRRVDPKPGDILYSRIGTIGEARLLEKFPPFIPLHSLVLIRPNKNFVTSKYLLYVLNSQIVRIQAKEKTRSIGTPDLGIREIRKFKIPVPTLEEQKRIVAYLDAVSERARQLVKLYEEREKKLEKLWFSALDKAFKGKL